MFCQKPTSSVVHKFKLEIMEDDINFGSTWAIVTLFLIGKLGITSSFAVVYAYTAEMMPTVIRSGGVGVMSTFARFGAMLAPFVPILGQYYEALPLLLFGGFSFSAGVLGLLLPETFRKKLPDTVAEAKNLGELDPSENVSQPYAGATGLHEQSHNPQNHNDRTWDATNRETAITT